MSAKFGGAGHRTRSSRWNIALVSAFRVASATSEPGGLHRVWGGAHDGCQLSTRRDAELGEDPVQVVADGAVREVELLADLPVAQPFRGQPGDLQLLRRQQVQHPRAWPAAALAS